MSEQDTATKSNDIVSELGPKPDLISDSSKTIPLDVTNPEEQQPDIVVKTASEVDEENVSSEPSNSRRSSELKRLLTSSKEANLDTNISYKRKSGTNKLKEEKDKMAQDNKQMRYPVTAETELEEQYDNEVKLINNLDTKSRTFKRRRASSVIDGGTGGATDEAAGKRNRKTPVSDLKMFKPNKDMFCWRCHRDAVNITCETCPRSYHQRCLKQTIQDPDHWPCPECVSILKAESTQTQSEAMRGMNLEHLCSLLKFALNRMILCQGAEPFLHPVSDLEFPEYKKYIVQPMTLTKIEENIKGNLYGSTQAFEADAKWLLHNSIIFNSYQSKLTSCARSMIKICKQEMGEIENCPSCYLNANTKKDTWFIEVCPKPHLLVWAKLKGFPYWPAKYMCANSTDMVDVRFFGAHDRAWVHYKECFLYSKKDPNTFKQKRYDIEKCIDELNEYADNLRKVYGEFRFAPFRITLDPKNELEQLQIFLPTYKSGTCSMPRKSVRNRKDSETEHVDVTGVKLEEKENNSGDPTDESEKDSQSNVDWQSNVNSPVNVHASNDVTMEGYGTDDEKASQIDLERRKAFVGGQERTDEDDEEDNDTQALNNVSVDGSVISRSNVATPVSVDRSLGKVRVYSRRKSEVDVTKRSSPDVNSPPRKMSRRNSDHSVRSDSGRISVISDKISENMEISLGNDDGGCVSISENVPTFNGESPKTIDSAGEIKIKPVQVDIDNAEFSISPASKLKIADKLMQRLSDVDGSKIEAAKKSLLEKKSQTDMLIEKFKGVVEHKVVDFSQLPASSDDNNGTGTSESNAEDGGNDVEKNIDNMTLASIKDIIKAVSSSKAIIESENDDLESKKESPASNVVDNDNNEAGKNEERQVSTDAKLSNTSKKLKILIQSSMKKFTSITKPTTEQKPKSVNDTETASQVREETKTKRIDSEMDSCDDAVDDIQMDKNNIFNIIHSSLNEAKKREAEAREPEKDSETEPAKSKARSSKGPEKQSSKVSEKSAPKVTEKPSDVEKSFSKVSEKSSSELSEHSSKVSEKSSSKLSEKSSSKLSEKPSSKLSEKSSSKVADIPKRASKPSSKSPNELSSDVTAPREEPELQAACKQDSNQDDKEKNSADNSRQRQASSTAQASDKGKKRKLSSGENSSSQTKIVKLVPIESIMNQTEKSAKRSIQAKKMIRKNSSLASSPKSTTSTSRQSSTQELMPEEIKSEPESDDDFSESENLEAKRKYLSALNISEKVGDADARLKGNEIRTRAKAEEKREKFRAVDNLARVIDDVALNYPTEREKEKSPAQPLVRRKSGTLREGEIFVKSFAKITQSGQQRARKTFPTPYYGKSNDTAAAAATAAKTDSSNCSITNDPPVTKSAAKQLPALSSIMKTFSKISNPPSNVKSNPSTNGNLKPVILKSPLILNQPPVILNSSITPTGILNPSAGLLNATLSSSSTSVSTSMSSSPIVNLNHSYTSTNIIPPANTTTVLRPVDTCFNTVSHMILLSTPGITYSSPSSSIANTVSPVASATTSRLAFPLPTPQPIPKLKITQTLPNIKASQNYIPQNENKNDKSPSLTPPNYQILNELLNQPISTPVITTTSELQPSEPADSIETADTSTMTIETTAVATCTTTTAVTSTTTTTTTTTSTNDTATETSTESSQEDEFAVLNSLVPERVSKAVSELLLRPPPRLKPRPPGMLSNVFDEGAPSSAGSVTSKINAVAHRLGDYFRGMLIETIEDLGRSTVKEARLIAIQLELEAAKHRHALELKEIRKNICIILKDIQKSVLEDRERIIDETRAACEAETIKRVELAKSKQWCANCTKEAQFYCCWNTSYCDYPCQQKHWPQHLGKCTQSIEKTNYATPSAPPPTQPIRPAGQSIILRPAVPPKPGVGRTGAKPTKVYMNRAAVPPKAFKSISSPNSHITVIETTPGNYELVGNGPIAVTGKIYSTGSSMFHHKLIKPVNATSATSPSTSSSTDQRIVPRIAASVSDSPRCPTRLINGIPVTTILEDD